MKFGFTNSLKLMFSLGAGRFDLPGKRWWVNRPVRRDRWVKTDKSSGVWNFEKYLEHDGWHRPFVVSIARAA